ncbi:hypothetical protein LTR36_004162 [Oleoguttula mirabilis]|uniref:Uncharacterized protein n=1 Tax=Oleoguttula mirabilis TaxID=1507867 RepID=A0AAV9JHY5_9PEZI|nr:hypothetical protein LTR36_004162 [Oleoguttula mirabilis]
MLTYEPLITALLKKVPHERLEEIMTAFHHDAKAKFNIDRIVTARVGDLFVQEIGVPFEIRESDGQETVFDVSRRKEIVIVLPVAESSTMAPATRTDTLLLQPVVAIAAQPVSASREVPAAIVVGAGKSAVASSAGNNFLPLAPAPAGRDMSAAGSAVGRPVGGK